MTRRKILLGCLPLLIIAVAGLFWATRALRSAPKPITRFEVVDQGDVEITVTETGTIEPLKKVEVKSRIGGRIDRMPVEEGDSVRAGDLLALIDPTEINSQVAQIRAQMDGAQARLRQSERSVLYQGEQTSSSIEQARENLRSAQSRLTSTRIEATAQPARTQSDIASAQATLAGAKNSLALLQQATLPQQSVTAEAEYRDAQARVQNSRQNLERQQSLLKKGFVAEQLVDNARADLVAAEARRDQAKSRLDLVAEQNRLQIAEAEERVRQADASLSRARADRTPQTRRQEVASAEAAVRQAQAQLNGALSGKRQNNMRGDEVAQARASVQQLQNQLSEIAVRQGDTRLTAPMSGVVTQRYVEAGELITSGVSAFQQQAVLQIADLSRMLVKLSVNEVDVQRIQRGLTVEIRVDGARGTVFQGRVRQVAPASSSAAAQNQQQGSGASGGVVRFPVEILIENPDNRLRPGMSARCTIVIARRKDVLRVPENCVQGEGKNASVEILVPAPDKKSVDTWSKRTIVAGLRGDSHIEIVSGLQVGEKVKPGKYTGPPRKAFEMNFGDGGGGRNDNGNG